MLKQEGCYNSWQYVKALIESRTEQHTRKSQGGGIEFKRTLNIPLGIKLFQARANLQAVGGIPLYPILYFILYLPIGSRARIAGNSMSGGHICLACD